MSDQRTPTLANSRRSSKGVNNASPQTPMYAPHYGHHEVMYTTPSTAGRSSDPRNSMSVRRPMQYSVMDVEYDRDSMLVELGRFKEGLKHKESYIKDLELKLELAIERGEDLGVQVPGLEAQIVTLRGINDELTQQIVAKEATINHLEDRLSRANQTIRVQSEQISNPKDGRTYGPPQTNHDETLWDRSGYEIQRNRNVSAITQGTEGFTNSQSFSSDLVRYQGPPAVRDEQTPFYHGEPGNHNALTLRRGLSQHSNSFLGKESVKTLSAAAPSFTPFQATRYDPSIKPGLPRFLAFAGPAATRAYFEYAEHGVPLDIQLKRFYNASEAWAKHFANVPNREKDGQVSPEVYGIASTQSDRDQYQALLADTETRHLTVARIINSNMTNFACYPLLVRGFKTTYDLRLHVERNKMYTGCPDYVRKESVANTAVIVNEIVNDPDWKLHIDTVMEVRVRELHDVLLPLMATDSDQRAALAGLTLIMGDAVKIGINMLQKVSMFGTDFPPTGPNSPFNPANMENRDTGFTDDDVALGRMGLKVRLAFAPVVTETPMSPKSKMRPETVICARVLLMH